MRLIAKTKLIGLIEKKDIMRNFLDCLNKRTIAVAGVLTGRGVPA